MSAASTPPPSELFGCGAPGTKTRFAVSCLSSTRSCASVARRHLRKERPDHTLQTTALIHEAYLRLVDQGTSEVRDHCHFVALTSHLMRQILVDHARARLAKKRDGGYRVTLAEDIPPSSRRKPTCSRSTMR